MTDLSSMITGGFFNTEDTIRKNPEAGIQNAESHPQPQKNDWTTEHTITKNTEAGIQNSESQPLPQKNDWTTENTEKHREKNVV